MANTYYCPNGCGTAVEYNYGLKAIVCPKCHTPVSQFVLKPEK